MKILVIGGAGFIGGHVALRLAALGKMADLPCFAPPGGVNFMSLEALSDALIGVLLKGEPGKSYLVADENLTYQQYFGCY